MNEQPTHWFKTTASDGKTYLAGFDDTSTAAVEHVVLRPDGSVESTRKTSLPVIKADELSKC